MAARKTLSIALAAAGALMAGPAVAAPPAPGEVLDVGMRYADPQPTTYCAVTVGAVTTIPKGGQYTIKWILGTQGFTVSDDSPIRGTEVFNELTFGTTAVATWEGLKVELYRGRKLVDSMETSDSLVCPRP